VKVCLRHYLGDGLTKEERWKEDVGVGRRMRCLEAKEVIKEKEEESKGREGGQREEKLERVEMSTIG